MKIRPVGDELFRAEGQTCRRTDMRTDRHDESLLEICERA